MLTRTTKRVQAGCDYLLRTYVAANGAFAALMPRPVPSKAVHCHNGELISALIRLGRLDDPRVQGALKWQSRAIPARARFNITNQARLALALPVA